MNLASLIALLEERGAITIVPTGRVPSLVELVTGGPIRGSWWAHPDGRTIFRLATELEASGRVVAAKLIDGKIALLDRSRWPALARVVTDRAWRAARIAALPVAARQLLDEIERADVTPTRAQTPLRRALEEALLVHASSAHTDRGHHATTLAAWPRVFPADVLRDARALTIARARETLAAALGGPLP